MNMKKRWLMVAVLGTVLSCLACGFDDKFVGTWRNETIDKDILTVKKSRNGYTVDALNGSFPCVKEDHLLKCKMGLGDTVFHVNDDGFLIMTTPLGLQFKFMKNESENEKTAKTK